jgi:hypothetical protein
MSRESGRNELVSKATDGTAGNDRSVHPTVSDDGSSWHSARSPRISILKIRLIWRKGTFNSP